MRASLLPARIGLTSLQNICPLLRLTTSHWAPPLRSRTELQRRELPMPSLDQSPRAPRPKQIAEGRPAPPILRNFRMPMDSQKQNSRLLRDGYVPTAAQQAIPACKYDTRGQRRPLPPRRAVPPSNPRRRVRARLYRCAAQVLSIRQRHEQIPPLDFSLPFPQRC